MQKGIEVCLTVQTQQEVSLWFWKRTPAHWPKQIRDSFSSDKRAEYDKD